MTDTAGAANFTTTVQGATFYVAFDVAPQDGSPRQIRVVRLANPLQDVDDVEVETLIADDVDVSDPSLAYDNLQQLAMAWVREGDGIRFARFQREDYTRQMMPARFGSDAATQPDIVKGANGEFGLVWTDVVDDESAVLFSRVDTLGQEASAPHRISPVGQDASDPHIAWSGGTYGITWRGTRDDVTHVHLVASRLNRPFEQLLPAPVHVDVEAGGAHGRLAWAGTRPGTYAVVWSRADDAWVRRYGRGGEALEAPIDLADVPSSHPLVAADDGEDGDSFLVTQERGAVTFRAVLPDREPIVDPVFEPGTPVGDAGTSRVRWLERNYVFYAGAEEGADDSHRLAVVNRDGTLGDANDFSRRTNRPVAIDFAALAFHDLAFFFVNGPNVRVGQIEALGENVAGGEAGVGWGGAAEISVAWDDGARHHAIAAQLGAEAHVRRIDDELRPAGGPMPIASGSAPEVAHGAGGWGLVYLAAPELGLPDAVFFSWVRDDISAHTVPTQLSSPGALASDPHLLWTGTAWAAVWVEVDAEEDAHVVFFEGRPDRPERLAR